MIWTDIPEKCGVYVLYLNGACVYVGGSVRLRTRIRYHNKRGLFDDVVFELCSPKELDGLEQSYIERLQPTLNKVRTIKTCRGTTGDKGKVGITINEHILAITIRELAERERRPIVNMIEVLLHEAIAARKTEK